MKESDAAERRAGNETRGVLKREFGDIHGMEAVHILAGIDGADDRGFVDLRRGRGLDEDAVNGGVGVEFFDEGEKFLLRGVGGEFLFHGVESEFGGLAVFRAHVGAGSRVVADEHHG